MKNRGLMLVLLSLITIAAVTSSFICFQRIMVEKQNNSVELVADYTDIENIASSEGLLIGDLLKRYRDAGIYSVAVTENTLVDSEKEGLLTFSPGYLLKTGAYNPGRNYVFVKDEQYYSYIFGQLQTAFGKKTFRSRDHAIEIPGNQDELLLKGVGLSPVRTKNADDAGLRVIPRLKNSYSLDKAAIEGKIASAASLSMIDTIVFDGEEIMGYPNFVNEAADILKSDRIRYGYIELAEQSGDASLLKASGRNIIRLHSVPADEMEIMKKNEVIQRLLRAAQERGIRMLYIHTYPYPDKGSSVSRTNINIINDLNAKLRASGYFTGKASVPGNISTNKAGIVLLSLGISAGMLLLLGYFIDVSMAFAIIVLALTSAAALGLDGLAAKRIFSLLSAVIFPIYAVISQYPAKAEEKTGPELANAVFTVLYMVGITFIGASIIAALLADTGFMMGLQVFSGVKIALLVPILTVLSYFFLRDPDGRINIKDAWDKTMNILNSQVTVMSISIILLGSAAFAVMILRSGNFGLPVPLLEKFGRGFLETILAVRPRTKELLIGYPALLLGAVYFLRGGRTWLPVWAAIGSLALISMTNSFCHIHTPLVMTVVRSCYGLILGLLIGAFSYFLYSLCASISAKIIKK